ncbi:fructosamine kinase family protein [Leeuwenhoekiella sp. NPDC079379]|uniref:fructosamine kinase family protein n=1 Tax=Leeuwenhoekiella sp. NPDC079379 TaxID=3364122 RepID=UPI0037C9EDFA
MLNDNFKEHLQNALSVETIQITSLTGGDINDVYKLSCSDCNYVIKVNDVSAYPNMFKLEAQGLEFIRTSESFPVPDVLTYDNFENLSYLILEYLETGPKNSDFNNVFGSQLAALHKSSSHKFGFENDNYIGSLKQFNTSESTAYDFYINQRLEPQFKLAVDNGYSFNSIDLFYKEISQLIPLEKPALIHGDLWSGNYLINSNGGPSLIDPAVSFAPREMDIALMHLFGGFDPHLFDTYNSQFPLKTGWKKRLQLWQLYYILVHVNLFGGSYYTSAKAILKAYI